MLAFPLVSLTTGYESLPEASKPGTKSSVKESKVPTLVRLRFAHRPLTVSLKQGDEELAAKADLASSPVEFTADLALEKGTGHELMLGATWPEGTPDTALTVELEPDGLETRSETRWASGADLNEVLTFTW